MMKMQVSQRKEDAVGVTQDGSYQKPAVEATSPESVAEAKEVEEEAGLQLALAST